MSGEEEAAAAAAAKTGEIAVWWDMKDCPVPEGIEAHLVRASIEGGFKEKGYSGRVSITAYGDQKQTPEHLLRALSSTGIAVVHTRSESTCAVMYEDMVAWREDNPPPATMMIISNQVLDVFDWDLSRLQQRTSYDLFLAYSVEPRAELLLYTCKEWLWEKLLTKKVEVTTTNAADTTAVLFYCKSCSLDCQTIKSFKKHLSTKKHTLEELLRPACAELESVTSKWGKNYIATPEYATAKIHVWWDMLSCPIPDGYDACRVRPSLEAAFKELGYSGPVSITAFGDHKQTPKHQLQALSSTGIDVAHVIPEVINSRMSDDLTRWRKDNPTPATMMIISDDFEDVLEYGIACDQQQRNKYNIFRAYSFRPRELSVLLTSAEWLWDSLLASETKRHVLRKCSGSNERFVESTGMFYCHLCWSILKLPSSGLKVCFYKRKLVDKFMKHLSSKKHLAQEECITDRRQRSENLRLFWLEKERFPETKRLRKSV